MYVLPKEGGWKRVLLSYGVYFLGKKDEIHKHIFQINLKEEYFNTCGSKLVGKEAQ